MTYAVYNICPSPTLSLKLSSLPARKRSIKRYAGFSRELLMQSSITPRLKSKHWNQPNWSTFKKSERRNGLSPREVGKDKRKNNQLSYGDWHSWVTYINKNHKAMLQQLSIWQRKLQWCHSNLVFPRRPIMNWSLCMRLLFRCRRL
jgi:hypothetical protein